MTLLLKNDGDDYIKIHDKYVGTSNNGSDDESGLVKDEDKHFEHFQVLSVQSLSIMKAEERAR